MNRLSRRPDPERMGDICTLEVVHHEKTYAFQWKEDVRMLVTRTGMNLQYAEACEKLGHHIDREHWCGPMPACRHTGCAAPAGWTIGIGFASETHVVETETELEEFRITHWFACSDHVLSVADEGWSTQAMYVRTWDPEPPRRLYIPRACEGRR